MKKILFMLMMICTLFICGCSADKACNCDKKYLYRESVSAGYSNGGWKENTNLYENLPEGAEIVQIIDTTTDSNYPKYDIIYTIHHCKK